MPKAIQNPEPEIEEQDQTNIQSFKQTLVLEWSGKSLVDLARNPSAAIWTVPSEEIFYDGMDTSVAKVVKEQDLLKNAILVHASVKKVQSTFPCKIAVNISDVKGKKYALSNGERADYVAFNMENNCTMDEVVFDAEHTLNSAYIANHSQYMPERFSDDILAPVGAPYSYVPIGHPLVDMINELSTELQVVLTPKDLVDERYYKIKTDVVEGVKEAMLPKIQSLFTQTNLSDFQVSIARGDGLAFDDPNGVLDNIHKPEVQNKTMNHKRSLSIVLDIAYAFIATPNDK